ncbi:MAG: hypothetical protein HGA85_09290 [Nanoarchaeota archaeon]|nr:hypothetical protein [Nanoarchaeota archaeon]
MTYTLEERIKNIEKFIFYLILSFLLFTGAFIFVLNTQYRNIFTIGFFSIILGITFGNLLTSVIIIGYVLGGDWHTWLHRVYEKHKDLVEPLIKYVSIAFFTFLGMYLLNQGIASAVGTIVLGILVNFLWDEFKKRKRKQHMPGS